MVSNPLSGGVRHQEDHWIPLSDLMTGLMMFFMLLAIAFMLNVEADEKKIEANALRVKQIAILYDQLKFDLYKDLEHEFQSDLPRWRAELDRDLTIRFKEPDVLFDIGSANIKPRFKVILDDFFPRYVGILASAKYRNSIEEIRIEGHTSSIWGAGVPSDDAYFRNMDLSQSRTRSTLSYVLNVSDVQTERPWLRRYLTANGLSSSKPILNLDGKENFNRSQRVEFRVRTDAESKIANIIEAAEQ